MKKIKLLLHVMGQGFANVFRNKWYSLASVATISLCLFVFGACYAIVANVQNMVMTAEEGVSLTVFFHSEGDLCESHQEGQIPQEQWILDFQKEIDARPEVLNSVFISDEEAWAEFGKNYFGEDFDDYAVAFPENPLAGDNSYEIFVTEVELQETVVEWLNGYKEVRKVNYSEVTVDTLSGFNKLLVGGSIAFILILLGVSIFLIGNTVAIGISVRSEEINIMKYIGATDFYVRSPFVMEGMLIGLVGAGLSLGLIYGLYGFVLSYVVERFEILSNFLNFMTVGEVFKVLLPASLIVGMGIGFIGSILAARKHLRV